MFCCDGNHARETVPHSQRQQHNDIAHARDREADTDEIESVLKFVEKHGLPAFCRVVFNSNEFVVVE